jgi:hypothetical protein
VRITIDLDPSWAAVPHAVPRLLAAAAALERPRAPGDDADDLTTLLDGLLDTPEPQPAPQPAVPRPSPAPSPATPPAREWDGVPRTGKGLYKWACNAKCLPKVSAIGKSFNYPKLVSDWTDDQVAAAYAVLTTEPALNGRVH